MSLYLMLINIITLILFAIDKLKAKSGAWRISERILLIFVLMGGSVGALLGMMLCRHKIRKLKFKLVVPSVLILQIIIIHMLN